MKKKYIFLLIFIEIILITLLIYFFVPKSGLNTHVEAVNMNLTNYKYDYYVQRNLIKIAGDVGTASYVFKGMPAVYDIKIAYVDEDDGNCTYTVDIKGKEVASWVADKNPTKDSIFIYSINDVKLDYGTEIKITGIRNKGEGARIAYLDITYSRGMSIKSVFKYTFSYLINNMPVTSIFVLIFAILLFLVVNIVAFILLRPRKKRPAKSLDIDFKTEISIENQEVEKVFSPATVNSNIKINNSDTLVASENKYNASDETEISGELNKANMPLIDKLISYLENNYSDSNFSVQEMADYFNLSINYLSSYFKEQTNENIINYITYLRIEKAKHLLVSTDLSIKNIAESSGYYNVSSFIRRFKQVTGVTPGKYREDNTGNQNQVFQE